jgi:hypothetical protein
MAFVAALWEVPFSSLRRTGATPGDWPRVKSFWWLAALTLAISSVLFSRHLLAIGINAEVGFRMMEEPPLISPTLETILGSLAVCCVWFAMHLAIWKTSKTLVNTWPLIVLFLDAYCLAVLLAGFFRVQTAERLATALF